MMEAVQCPTQTPSPTPHPPAISIPIRIFIWNGTTSSWPLQAPPVPAPAPSFVCPSPVQDVCPVSCKSVNVAAFVLLAGSKHFYALQFLQAAAGS